ncbi:MAG: septum formation initiator family protein [Ruminococcaceae bacterium]|nr:septum formation initiator family protein [Oscillospiraceae bacterium]
MRIPIKFRRTSLLTKLVILVLLISCAALLVSQQSQRRANEAKARELAQQVAELKEENQDLQEDIAGLGSDSSVVDIAREELGLVGNGEIIFSDIGD